LKALLLAFFKINSAFLASATGIIDRYLLLRQVCSGL
jgi:hypothetical protein